MCSPLALERERKATRQAPLRGLGRPAARRVPGGALPGISRLAPRARSVLDRVDAVVAEGLAERTAWTSTICGVICSLLGIGSRAEVTGSSRFHCDNGMSDVDITVWPGPNVERLDLLRRKPPSALSSLVLSQIGCALSMALHGRAQIDSSKLFTLRGEPKAFPVLSVYPLCPTPGFPTGRLAVDVTYGCLSAVEFSAWVNREVWGQRIAASGLAPPTKLAFLRLVKLWTKRRQLPTRKQGGTASVVWTVMSVHATQQSGSSPSPAATVSPSWGASFLLWRFFRLFLVAVREDQPQTQTHRAPKKSKTCRLPRGRLGGWLRPSGDNGALCLEPHLPADESGTPAGLYVQSPTSAHAAEKGDREAGPPLEVLSDELSVATQLAVSFEFCRALGAVERGDAVALFQKSEPYCSAPCVGDVAFFWAGGRCYLAEVSALQAPFFNRAPKAAGPRTARFAVEEAELDEGSGALHLTGQSLHFEGEEYVCRLFTTGGCVPTFPYEGVASPFSARVRRPEASEPRRLTAGSRECVAWLGRETGSSAFLLLASTRKK
jgi:hypothetical protein